MRNFQLRWQRIFCDGKSVILGCYLDLAGFTIQHRLVCATMAELQLERAGTTGERNELVTGERARQAFDIAAEDDKTRDRYGRTREGQSLLLARRSA